MIEKIGSHTAFRRNYISYPDSEAEADLSWMKGWPKSADLILQFFDAVVYTNSLDASLRTGLKHRKSPEEILQYGAFQERLDEVLEALKTEANATAAGAPGSASVAGKEDCDNGVGGPTSKPGAAAASGAVNGPTFEDDTEKHWHGVAERIVKHSAQHAH